MSSWYATCAQATRRVEISIRTIRALPVLAARVKLSVLSAARLERLSVQWEQLRAQSDQLQQQSRSHAVTDLRSVAVPLEMAQGAGKAASV